MSNSVAAERNNNDKTQQQQTVELPDNEAVGVLVGGIGVSGGLCGVN